jgi:hypothetical protein
LLGKYDINFYLADKPPEFLWAVGLAGLLLAGFGIIVLKKVASWILTIRCARAGGRQLHANGKSPCGSLFGWCRSACFPGSSPSPSA